MLRRVWVPLVVALSVLGGVAVPATAYPDETTCVTYPHLLTQTRATICVDVSGSNRRVYVRGESQFAPTTLTVNYAQLEQFSAGSGETVFVVDDCCGWSSSSYLKIVEYRSTSAPVQFGHSYRACARVGVRDGLLGGHDFDRICSLYRVN